MAVVTNEVQAKLRASSTSASRGCATATGGCDAEGAAAVSPEDHGGGAAVAARGSQALSGSPNSRCSAAQAKQASRQPQCAAIQADSGQPTVLAKPPNSVTPVMALRARGPYSRTRAEKAASYRPQPMPTPSSIQPANSIQALAASPSTARPSANTTFDAMSTGRPPRRSMARPAQGPVSAETPSAMEKAAKTVGSPSPSERAMGAASTAGRYCDEAQARIWAVPRRATARPR